MSNEQDNVMDTLAEALPQMSDFQRGYFLGAADTILEKQKRGEDNAESQASGV